MTHRALWALAAALVLAGCGGPGGEEPPAAVEAAATIFPLADVTQRLGGEHVRVHLLLEPGQSPHQVQLSPRQTERLARADLLVRVGRGLDDWVLRPAQAVGGELHVLTVAEHADLPDTPGDDHEGEHDESHAEHAHDEHRDEHDALPAPPAADEHGHAHDGDPHIWLDPVAMQSVARAIAAELIALDPAHRADYEANLRAFLAELQQLDADYRQALAALERRQLVTYHEAFTYLAARYGLEHMALADVTGAGLGAGRLQRVVDFLRRHDVRVVFTEPQFPAERLELLAREAGVTVAHLDPLGGPGREGYDSYLAMMRSNLAAIVAAGKD